MNCNSINFTSVLKCNSFRQYLIESLKLKLFQSFRLSESFTEIELDNECFDELSVQKTKTKNVVFVAQKKLLPDLSIQKLVSGLVNYKSVQLVLNTNQILENQEFFKSLYFSLKSKNINFNFEIRLEQIVKAGIIDINKLQLLNEFIKCNDFKKNFLLTFKVTKANCFFTDDILKSLSKISDQLYFYPESDFFIPLKKSINEQMLFHVSMFFDQLTQLTKGDLFKRMYYRRLVRLLKLNKKPSELLNLNSFQSIANLPEFIIIPKLSELRSFTIEILRSYLRKSLVFSNRKKNLRITKETVNPKKWNLVLITGWYGTETNGDKAILGEVLHFLKESSPDCDIILTTIHPIISEQTHLELELLKNVTVIEIEKAVSTKLIKQVDAVIMGGGPLMDSAQMENIYKIFYNAAYLNKNRIIFGCGIGPIHLKRTEWLTKEILMLSSAGFLRDQESFEYANRLFPEHPLKYSCDPAIAFVSRWRKVNIERFKKSDQTTIACLVRANTNEFSANQSADQLGSSNINLATSIANLMKSASLVSNYNVDLLHMNTPWVGGDDRLFNRFIADQFEQKNNINLYREYLTLEDHLSKMCSAKVSIAMRYHGHIFSMALGIPFLSIDYTGKKGKVSSLTKRISYDQWSLNWEEINSVQHSKILDQLIVDRNKWSQHLLEQTEILVLNLYKTYTEIFNVNIKHH